MARTPMLHAIQRLLLEHARARSASLSVGTWREREAERLAGRPDASREIFREHRRRRICKVAAEAVCYH